MKSVFEKIIEKLYVNDKDQECPEITCWVHSSKDCDKCDLKKISVRDAIEIVSQAAEEYGDWWIPCSDRLPQRQDSENIFPEMYLVQLKDERMYKGFRREDGKWINEHGNILNGVVAWRPLPAPYKPTLQLSPECKQHIMNRFTKVE